MTVTVKPKAPAPVTGHPPKAKPKALKTGPAPSIPEDGTLPISDVQLTAKQGSASVTKSYKDGTVIESHEDVGPPVVASAPMANVGLSMGMTKTLAQYENVKFQVSLYLPCASDPEEINATFEAAKEWVSERVEQIAQEIQDQIDQ